MKDAYATPFIKRTEPEDSQNFESCCLETARALLYDTTLALVRTHDATQRSRRRRANDAHQEPGVCVCSQPTGLAVSTWVCRLVRQSHMKAVATAAAAAIVDEPADKQRRARARGDGVVVDDQRSSSVVLAPWQRQRLSEQPEPELDTLNIVVAAYSCINDAARRRLSPPRTCRRRCLLSARPRPHRPSTDYDQTRAPIQRANKECCRGGARARSLKKHHDKCRLDAR